MSAVREQILEAIKARLQTIVGFTGLEVHRNISYPEDDEKLPVLIVVDGDQEPISDSPSFLIQRMSMSIDGMVKADVDGQQGTLANALYLAVVKVLMADPSYGQLAIDTREGTLTVSIDRTRGAPFVAAFQLQLLVDFATRDNAPDQLAP